MHRLLLLLGLLLAAPAAGQSAEAWYHDAAARYIAGDDAGAEAAAERGLRQEPEHPRLLALLEAIRQRPPQASGSTGPSGPDSDTPQPGGDEPEGGEDPGEGSGGDAPPEEPEPDEGQGEGSDEGDPRPGSAGAPTEAPSEGLSRAEAERLLRAIEADEAELLRRVQRRPERPRTTDRNW
jgi:hypothetical protein